DSFRADGIARTSERGLIGGHECRRPRQTGKAHARKTGAAQIIIYATALAIEARLHVFRQFHCLVSFVRNSSSGHESSAGPPDSGSPKCSVVPSGNVRLVAPAFRARFAIVVMLGLVRRPSGVRARAGLSRGGAWSNIAA